VATDDAIGVPVGFMTVAMMQTRGLRPARLPRVVSRDFFLVGTRVFVRFSTRDGRTLRGLYSLRSQTDSRAMQHLGEIFTRYRYEHLDVAVEQTPDRIAVRAGAFVADFDTAAAGDAAPPLPAGSPFSTWKDARRFAGTMPHTCSMLDHGCVLVVEGVHQNWKPRPVRVLAAHVPSSPNARCKTPCSPVRLSSRTCPTTGTPGAAKQTPTNDEDTRWPRAAAWRHRHRALQRARLRAGDLRRRLWRRRLRRRAARGALGDPEGSSRRPWRSR